MILEEQNRQIEEMCEAFRDLDAALFEYVGVCMSTFPIHGKVCRQRREYISVLESARIRAENTILGPWGAST